MLDKITIDNFATIEHVEFDLGDSLNMITGETGTGKSVLIEAISTALGDRADISMVRTGTEKALIQISGTKNGEELVISRELLSSGKSVSKINGELVTLTYLKKFCEGFADIHGQYDNQQILDPDNHIKMLDSFDIDDLNKDLSKLSALYDQFKSLSKEYESILTEEKNTRRQQGFYSFEYKYITDLHLVSGEEEDLREQLGIMKNSSRIFNAVKRSYELIHENEPSVISSVGNCMSELDGVSSFSEELSTLSSDVTDLYYQLEDISDRLRYISGSLSFSDENMDAASERLSLIEDAKRKYSTDIEGIIAYAEELSEKLNLLDNFDDEKKRLLTEIGDLKSEMQALAEVISKKRRACAKWLEKNMMKELEDLEFANNEFEVSFEKLDEISSSGFDKVEFLISTNPGEPLKPLTKIASGGEISRIMLAFKHITGDTDKTETMIFDEIDTGISGRTALVVGKKLKEISEHHQILCITHLPQIAACGDDNYLISKSQVDGKSSTAVTRLDDEGRLHAIASLIIGDADNEVALEAARELVKNK